MKEVILEVKTNEEIAPNTYEMVLVGDISEVKTPGQFVNIKLEGFYLRRPISVCDVNGDELTIIYKTVGKGTEEMSYLDAGSELDVLTGLGNGYDLSLAGDKPLLIGGGAGVPPMYYLAKKLSEMKVSPKVIMGFNSKNEIFYESEFRNLGCEVFITCADGSYGIRGFVTDALPEDYSYVYTCGPEPMLRAIFNKIKTSGQFSFEERMGCGFGACMGCSCKTITGYKRICKDGPVLRKEEILWED